MRKHRRRNTRRPALQSGVVSKPRYSWWAMLGSAILEHGICWKWFSRNLVQNSVLTNSVIKYSTISLAQTCGTRKAPQKHRQRPSPHSQMPKSSGITIRRSDQWPFRVQILQVSMPVLVSTEATSGLLGSTRPPHPRCNEHLRNRRTALALHRNPASLVAC